MALMLAAVGIFGVLSYLVAQRTHEIGIRVALGASRADVVRLVLSETGGMVAVGVIAGLAAAAALTGVARSMIYGVTGIDPFTFGAVAAVLAMVGLISAAIPARRAAAVDPMVALRTE
jgi:putative ABC transport system permease protein